MAFITQHGARPEDEIAELEALVSGVNQISQSTLLLKKKKEMHEVDDSLDFMKEEYKSRVEACDERQREFERKQMDMKEQVTKFEKFIQENDSKRQRAEMKTQQEHKVLLQKEAELKRLQKLHGTAERERAALIGDLEQLKKYRVYLEGTVDHSEDESYEEIWDLLNRHKTLRSANTQLMEQVQEGDEEIDKLRTKLQELKHETQNQMLVSNSYIHTNQKRVEQLRAAVKKGADEKETEEDRIKDVNRNTGQVISSVKNLYTRCLATNPARVSAVVIGDHDSTDAKLKKLDVCLKAICERIIDLRDITDGWQSLQQRETHGHANAGGGSYR